MRKRTLMIIIGAMLLAMSIVSCTLEARLESGTTAEAPDVKAIGFDSGHVVVLIAETLSELSRGTDAYLEKGYTIAAYPYPITYVHGQYTITDYSWYLVLSDKETTDGHADVALSNALHACPFGL